MMNRTCLLRSVAILFAAATVIVGMLVLMELVRYVTIVWAVENAARFGIRYAVTDMWDKKYCDNASLALGLTRADMSDGRSDCNAAMHFPNSEMVTRQMRNWARLSSIQDAVYRGANGIGALQIVVCSDRQGYGYDPQRDACMPRDDPSEPGGKVMVSVTSYYSVGSSIGLNLYQLRIHSFRMGIVEVFR